MTIYDIKRLTEKTAPYFFSRDTLRFFGQTMKSFRVYKLSDDRYLVTAPYGPGKPKGVTVRYFNPKTNELENN